MIGRLRGELLDIEGNIAVVEACGVGYEVMLPESVLAQMPPKGEPVDLRIRQIFREDGVSLYGFIESFQRRLFDLLTGVKGCGPRIGLALIGQLGENAVAAAITTQDAKVLSRASGVGPRLAERIILELKDKMSEEVLMNKVSASAVVQSSRSTPSDELVDALVALGYRRLEAEATATEVRQEADTVEEQIRLALRSLRK